MLELRTHAPSEQLSSLVHTEHVSPCTPHAICFNPVSQTLSAVQHPMQFVGLHGG